MVISLRCRLWDFKPWRLSVQLLAVALLIAAMTPAPAAAQSGGLPPEKVDQIIQSVIHELNARPSTDAQDYLDILIRLQDLIDDYDEYLIALPDSLRKSHALGFRKFRQRMADDSYAEQPELLGSDLDQFIEELDVHERAHRHGGSPPRCCAMVRNLRKELQVLAELARSGQRNRDGRPTVGPLVRELRVTLDSLRASGHTLVISAELLGKLDELSRQNTDLARLSKELARLSEIDAGTKVILRKLERATRQEDVSIVAPAPPPNNHRSPVLAKLPEVAPVQNPPSLPLDWTPARPFSRNDPQQLTASMELKKDGLPIAIDLPAGQLTITKSPTDLLQATFQCEIDGASPSERAALGKRITLSATRETSRYVVSVTLPEQLLARGTLIDGTMALQLPQDRQLTITHRSGSAVISNYQGTIDYAGQFSSVSLAEIRGDIRAQTSMGAVHASEINGDLSLSTSYHPMLVSNVSGNVTLTNQYAETLVSSLRGNLTVSGTGKVAVSSQSGNLQITNSYGQVLVRQVSGSASIVNAFGEIEVQEIGGDAELVNNYARVSAARVQGELTARNSFGEIDVHSLSGRINLLNSSGPIRIVIRPGETPSGTIASTAGAIDLLISPQSSLQVQATTNGTLVTGFPAQIRDNGVSRSLNLSLGQAGRTLTIRGQASNILISRLDPANQ